MKVAFLVVYIFDETTRPLFDYHLDRLRRHTDVPFRILASLHKLKPEFHAHVAAQPDIEIVDCNVPAGMNIRQDHSYALAALAEHAFKGDYSHAMTLHMDSFPVADGWFESFADGLGPEAAFACLTPHGYSAGLLIPRGHYEAHRPEMLVADDTRMTDVFARFQADHPGLDHAESGLGYIYQAWQKGLNWRRLGTDRNEKIYEGKFFHFVAATHMTRTEVIRVKRGLVPAALWGLIRPILRVLPDERAMQIRTLFLDLDRKTRDGTPRGKRAELAEMLADIDLFVERCLEAYPAEEGPAG